jgi:hypothetical protein
MASYVNVKKTYTGAGNKDAIQLNRWSRDNYSLKMDVTGTIDFTVQGTLDYVNRSGETVTWSDIDSLVNLTASSFEKITDSPLEAIRVVINSGAGSVLFHVAQNGE